MGVNDTNRYIWQHQLVVVIPTKMSTRFNDAAALWITGGGMGDGVPGAWDEDMLVCASLATNTGTPCSVLYQVPNEPITFSNDPTHQSRSEDAAVAYTWAQYVNDPKNNSNVILYYPMVRAASKAMDAVRRRRRGPGGRRCALFLHVVS